MVDQEQEPKQPEKKISEFTVTIQDKAALYAAYMPYLKNGGLFIPTNKTYKMGETIKLNMKLMKETDIISFLTKIVWITPKGAQGVSGIGVEFSQEALPVRAKIETYLAGMLESDRPTHTM